MDNISDDIDGYSSLSEVPRFYVPKLSKGAKDLWAYLMHKPDNWKISIDFLYKFYDPEISCRVHCKDKVNIEKSLNELVKYDYIERNRICK